MEANPIPTPEQVFFDPTCFAETFLKVLDKNKRIVPLRYNEAQRHFLANRARRSIILKARQIGFTTLNQAEMFRYATTSTATTFTLTHLDSTTAAIRRIADRYYENLPIGFRPSRKYANATITTYPDFGSESIIATAGSVNSARGLTITHAHLSEVGFWSHADEVMTSVLQAVSPDGTITVESTANGSSGWLYDECMKALNGQSTFKLFFYPWFTEPSYQLPLKSDETLSYTDEEMRLVKQHNLTSEQINWRRSKVRELTLPMFLQEYAEDVITCFLTSGNSVFGDISEALIANDEPIATYNPKHVYISGVDWGQSADYSALSIIDVTDNREVVLWRQNHTRWDVMRAEIARLCNDWHVGHVYVEKNSASSNVEALQSELETLQQNQDWQASVIGFTTTNKRKAEMVNLFYRGIHEDGLKLLNPTDPNGFAFATAELRQFVSQQTSSGIWTYAAANEGHDDTVIARMAAYWGSLRLIPDGEW